MIEVCVSDVCYSFVFFFKQKTAYEMRISDWSSDVCSSDLHREQKQEGKLEKDLPQTDKSGDSLKGDTPEEDMPATEEEWSLWSQDIEADLHKADRADLVNEIAQREEKRLNAEIRKSTRLNSSH